MVKLLCTGLSVLTVIRHGVKDCGAVIQNLGKALAGLAQEAVR